MRCRLLIDFLLGNRSRTNLYDALSSNDPKDKKDVTNFMKWNLKMTIILRILGKKLSDTVAAWDIFAKKEIDCFDDTTIFPVEKEFRKLKEYLQRLRDLEMELHKDNPDGVSSSPFEAQLKLRSRSRIIMEADQPCCS